MGVLHVEDNALDADLARRALCAGDAPVELDQVHTLADARERLRHHERYDLVLTDLHLPDGHGTELIVEIRARALPLALVALTGRGEEHLALATLKAGADDYLAKSAGYETRLPGTLQAALRRFQGTHDRMLKPMRVLYAEHHPQDVDLTRRFFAEHAPHILLDAVPDAASALARLPGDSTQPCRHDLLMVDYRLPGDNGLELLKIVREDRGLDLAVVVVTGQGTEDMAVQAMHLGATDYVVKHPNYLHVLPATLENAAHRVAMQREHEALRRSEERLALVLRGSNDASWDIDLARGETFIAPRLSQMLGHGDDAVHGLAAARERFVPPAVRAALDAWFEQMLKGRADAFEHELRLLHKDGHLVPMLARGVVVRDTGGRATRVCGTLTDLTERKHAEAQIRELNVSLERRVAERTRALQQALDELESFSYTVSHDLRAPLRAIDGLSALLQAEHGSQLGEDAGRMLRMLRESAQHMDQLIVGLLDFSRTIRHVPRRTQVQPALLVRHCLAEMDEEIARRRIAVTVGELPACEGDAMLLRQVFANLLGNAVKYTRKCAEPRIEVGARKEGGDTVYYVRDNGAGFDMAHAGKLFAVFKRLHAASEFEGTGVGLAIAHRIVQRHGGRLWAEARKGDGACFQFTLGQAPDSHDQNL